MTRLLEYHSPSCLFNREMTPYYWTINKYSQEVLTVCAGEFATPLTFSTLVSRSKTLLDLPKERVSGDRSAAAHTQRLHRAREPGFVQPIFFPTRRDEATRRGRSAFVNKRARAGPAALFSSDLASQVEDRSRGSKQPLLLEVAGLRLFQQDYFGSAIKSRPYIPCFLMDISYYGNRNHFSCFTF